MFQTFFRDLFYRAAQYRMKPDGKGYEGRDDLGIYHHFTVAIDTDNIKRVFDDVRDMATDLNTLIYLKLQQNLKKCNSRIQIKYRIHLSSEGKHGSTYASMRFNH